MAKEGAVADLRLNYKQADPDIIEGVKYRKPSNPAWIPVWSHDGMVCTGEIYKDHLRFIFVKGTLLKDQKGLLNAFRSMVIYKDNKIDEAAFKNLIRAAVALNHRSS